MFLVPKLSCILNYSSHLTLTIFKDFRFIFQVFTTSSYCLKGVYLSTINLMIIITLKQFLILILFIIIIQQDLNPPNRKLILINLSNLQVLHSNLIHLKANISQTLLHMNTKFFLQVL